MADFNIDDFQTFDIQKRRQELANPSVSQAILNSRAQIVKGAQEYNKINQMVSLFNGRRPGPSMNIPTFNDGPTASQKTAANEAALTEFMRSLEKIQEQLGRPIKDSEIPAIARAYNIGPKGLDQLKDYFPYIGRTQAQDMAVSRQNMAEKRFAQEQEDRVNKIAAKNAEIKENKNIDLVVRRTSRMFREAQENGVLTYNKEQEIIYDAMKQSEMLGIDPDTVIKRAKNFLFTAPTTKQVIDTNTGQAVLRSNKEIANAPPDSYIPIVDDSGKLSSQAENAAIIAFSKIGMGYKEGLELVRLMEDLSPLVAMEKHPDLREDIVKILRNMQVSNEFLDFMIKGDAGSNTLRFE